MPNVSTLPALTKQHLFSLITNTTYRKNASKAVYDLKGPGSPGKPVKKYGWTSALPAGIEQKKPGQPDPGKYRLASYNKPGGGTFWYKMEHVAGNSYKFEAITNMPSCPQCKGTGDCVCTDCKGTGRVVVGNMSSACTKCRNANPLKNGLVACVCGGTNIANGVSVDPTFANW